MCQSAHVLLAGALALAASVAVMDPHGGLLSPASSAAIAETPSPAVRDAGMGPRIELVQYSTSPKGAGALQGPLSLTPELMIAHASLPEARLKADVLVRADPWMGSVVASLPAGTLVVVEVRGQVTEYGKWAQIALRGRPTLGWVQDHFLDVARKDERIDVRRRRP